MKRVTTLLTGTAVTGGGIQRFYFADATSASAAAVAAAIFWDALKSHMTNNVTMQVLDTVETVDETTGEVTALNETEGVTIVGENGEQNMALATQGLVRFRTGVYVGGREIRGRTFVPGCPISFNNDGVPSTAYVTELSNAADAIIGDAGSTLLVYSRTHGQAHAAASGSGWNKWAVLRSRRD